MPSFIPATGITLHLEGECVNRIGVVGTTETMISAYLAREIARIGGKPLPRGKDTQTFVMKHGPSLNHWNEYIFYAYSNFQRDVVFLSGIPDVKGSLPCAS